MPAATAAACATVGGTVGTVLAPQRWSLGHPDSRPTAAASTTQSARSSDPAYPCHAVRTAASIDAPHGQSPAADAAGDTLARRAHVKKAAAHASTASHRAARVALLAPACCGAASRTGRRVAFDSANPGVAATHAPYAATQSNPGPSDARDPQHDANAGPGLCSDAPADTGQKARRGTATGGSPGATLTATEMTVTGGT